MSLSLFLQLLTAIFRFPQELAALVRLLEKAPEEKRQEIVLEVGRWMAQSQTGTKPGSDEVEGPKWES